MLTKLITLSPIESSGGAFGVIENVHEQTVTVHRESGLRRAIMSYDGTELTTSSSWRLTAWCTPGSSTWSRPKWAGSI